MVKSDPSIVAFIFEGILLFTVSSIGIIGNVFNIGVLVSNRKTSNFTKTFVHLLITLSLFDMLYLIMAIGLFGLPALSSWYTNNVYLKILPTWIGLIHIGRVGSVFLTIAITIERYVNVCHPTTDFKMMRCLIPLPIISAILFNIPKFFEIETIQHSNSTSNINEIDEQILMTNDSRGLIKVENVGYRGTTLRLNYWYIILYVTWSKLLFVEIFPWVIIIALNILIWKRIRQYKSTRMKVFCKNDGNSHNETKILTSVVVVFIICQSFTIVADVYESVICTQHNVEYSICLSNDHIENIIDISHFMISINSSVNFLLYAYHDNIFRNALLKALCCGGIYGRLGNRIKDVLLSSRRHSRVSIEEPRNEKQGMELNNF